MSILSFFGAKKKPQSAKNTLKEYNSAGVTQKAPQGSPFTEEELTPFYNEMKQAYQLIEDAKGDVSPYVCPAEMPVYRIQSPDEIMRLCRMSRERSYQYILEILDSYDIAFYRKKAEIAISMYAYKQMGVHIPDAVADHITHAIQNIDASDAVELIRQYQLYDYDYNRAIFDDSRVFKVMPGELRKRQMAKQQQTKYKMETGVTDDINNRHKRAPEKWEKKTKDKLLSVPETKQETLAVRIGKRISEVLSKEELEEFDAISDPLEVAQWLSKHVPNYRAIIEEEKRKSSK